MPKKYLVPIALIFILLLAACGGSPAAEPGPAAEAVQPTAEAANMESMDEKEAEPDEEMAEESDEAMEAMDEEMAKESDEAMEAMDEEMDASHDDEMEAMEEEDMASSDEEMDTAAAAMDSEDEAMDEEAEMMMERPAWQMLAVTNAATGEPFTLADFQGKTVFVEPMATWCSNCRMQQFEVQQAQAQLGDDVVFVGLSLETTLPAGDLARYAQDHGFDWTYAVMSNELLAGLADEFGRSITSAPSTPHFVIRPDGSFSELSTGIHSAGEIVAEIQEAQS